MEVLVGIILGVIVACFVYFEVTNRMPWSKNKCGVVANNDEFHIQYSKDFQRKLNNMPFTTKYVTPEGNLYMTANVEASVDPITGDNILIIILK